MAQDIAKVGVVPQLQGTPVGGVGADGFFHLLSTDNTGALNTTGGGGGGGGAVTVADGADVTQGAIADAVVAAGATGTLSAKLRRLTTDLSTVATNTGAATPAGTALIGKVGIDQTTPGTTNAVAATNLPTTVDTNSGNKSASTLRFVLATDQPSMTNAQPVNVNTPSLYSSSANEASHAVKGSAGRLHSLTGYNARTSAQFIQIHNTTTVPADTAVPVLTFTVPASSNFSFDAGLVGLPLSTGISVCNSSTQATKTVGSADCFFTAVYV